MKGLCAALLCGWLAAGQSAPRIQRLATACSDREIQEFGLECTLEEPCRAYLEITAVERAGGKLFLAGNFHTDTQTLESVLLASEDDGLTWSEPHPRIRGASLEHFQFVDAETGWVSGLVAGSIAKDPFFLRTADGGKTWRRLNVFEDTEYATIEHFWFESKTHGMMVLNRRGQGAARYHRMESLSGGEGWMLREATPDPPPARRAGAGLSRNPECRVRIDAAAKAFRIERLSAARWTAVASFAFDGGACTPKPPPPPPPAEEKKPDAPEQH